MSGAGYGSLIEPDSHSLVESTTEPAINESFASRRRREQVRQACRHCRRRKIKCDEARPICKPCRKSQLACVYERPAAQTRIHALLESQQRLQEELHSHVSLICTLRCIASNTSIEILGRLRCGDYDKVLLGADSASWATAPEDRIYPWESSSDDVERHTELPANRLPPIDALLPTHSSGTVYQIPRPVLGTPGRQYKQNLGPGASGHVSTTPYAQPLGLQSVWMTSKTVLDHGQGFPSH